MKSHIMGAALPRRNLLGPHRRMQCLFLLLLCLSAAYAQNCPMNTILYSGYCYASMDQQSPTDISQTCQNTAYLPLPAGYTLVPYNSSVVTNVVAKYHWGTGSLLFDDGSAYSTLGYPPPGKQWNSLHDMLASNGTAYKVTACTVKVLMRTPSTKACGQQGTLDCPLSNCCLGVVCNNPEHCASQNCLGGTSIPGACVAGEFSLGLAGYYCHDHTQCNSGVCGKSSYCVGSGTGPSLLAAGEYCSTHAGNSSITQQEANAQCKSGVCDFTSNECASPSQTPNAAPSIAPTQKGGAEPSPPSASPFASPTVSKGIIAGIIIGVIVGITLIFFGGVFVARHAARNLPPANSDAGIGYVEMGDMRTSLGGGLRSPVSMSRGRSTTSSVTGREYNTIDFGGRLVKQQKFFIASFPGRYEDEWKVIALADLRQSRPSEQMIATSCVFYPDGQSELAGVHAFMTNSEHPCHCHDLYAGQPQFASWPERRAPWGCMWMQQWITNTRGCLGMGQVAVVVYWSRITIAGTGTALDGTECDLDRSQGRVEMPLSPDRKYRVRYEVARERGRSTGASSGAVTARIDCTATVKGSHLVVESLKGDNERGLGASQKGEVKWLERNGVPYVRWDIHDFMQHAKLLAGSQQAPQWDPAWDAGAGAGAGAGGWSSVGRYSM